jgi:DnaJ-class molecular chaperone
MAHKLRIPAARCPACGNVTRDFELVDRRCERTLGGARCRGVNSATHSYDDWQACAACDATGRLDRSRCGQCRGEGWIYVSSP